MNAPRTARPVPGSSPPAPAPRFVDSDTFLAPGQVSDAELLDRARVCLTKLESLGERERIPASLEAAAFRLFNWLKQRSALRAQPAAGSQAPGLRPRRQLEEAALAIRNELTTRFLPLLIGAARQLRGAEAWTNDELVSELAETLLAVVENFDADRGFRFSTYATLAIRRQTMRLLRASARQRQLRQPLNPDATEAPPLQSEQSAQRKWDASRRLIELIERLEPRERVILRARLGIDEAPRRPSLRRLGERLGLSRERIRQLEQRALRRIRQAADQQNISPAP